MTITSISLEWGEVSSGSADMRAGHMSLVDRTSRSTHYSNSRGLFATRFVLALVMCLFVASCAPKVIDPSDSHFDPMKFSFEDCKHIPVGETSAYFNHLFPAGTDKAYVDKILVAVGHAVPSTTANPSARYHNVGYSYKSHDGIWVWVAGVDVTYDTHDKVVTLHAGSGTKAF